MDEKGYCKKCGHFWEKHRNSTMKWIVEKVKEVITLDK